MNTMHRHNSRIAAIGALFAMAYPLAGAAAEDGRFEKLSVYLERNIQDRDAEIRFEATGGDDGLAALKVSAPGARTVIDLKSPDSKLGVRSLTLELPEPDDERSYALISRRAPIALRERRPKGTACAAKHSWLRVPPNLPRSNIRGRIRKTCPPPR